MIEAKEGILVIEVATAWSWFPLALRTKRREPQTLHRLSTVQIDAKKPKLFKPQAV
jgi:hypothetical protein